MTQDEKDSLVAELTTIIQARFGVTVPGSVFRGVLCSIESRTRLVADMNSARELAGKYGYVLVAKNEIVRVDTILMEQAIHTPYTESYVKMWADK